MPARHPRTALWLAGLYLVAVATAGRFHEHQEAAEPCHDACHSPVALGLDGQLADGAHHAPQVTRLHRVHDDQCPVCQFLGQKLTASVAEDRLGWQELPEVPAAAAPVRAPAAFPIIERSRAPPSLA